MQTYDVRLSVLTDDTANNSEAPIQEREQSHTGCTRLVDAGVPHPVVAEIMGWSTSTAIRMIKEVYGHISLATRLRAIEQVEAFMLAQKESDPAQNPIQSGVEQNATIQ